MKEKMFALLLQNEYNMIMSMPENDLVHIEPAPGETPPHVKHYLVTYHVPTWVKDDDGEIRLQDKTVLLFGRMALDDHVRVRVAEGRTPFHMNWFPVGHYSSPLRRRLQTPDRRLYEYVEEVLHALQFREEIMDIESPAWCAARDFWLEHRADEPPIFPTDTRELPQLPEREPKIRLVKPETADGENGSK